MIEALKPEQAFCVVTPVGSFQMTKAEFYRDFENVSRTQSYREKGIYHYPSVPHAAEAYRVADSDES